MHRMESVAPIRVPAEFEREFPGASRSGAEVMANLVRAADALLAEVFTNEGLGTLIVADVRALSAAEQQPEAAS